MSNDTKNKGIEASLKSMDTEEFIDIHFYRPIGYRWALLFQKLGVHPNVVTIASIFIGVAAGVMFYFDNLKLNIIGMLLLIWANSLYLIILLIIKIKINTMIYMFIKL